MNKSDFMRLAVDLAVENVAAGFDDSFIYDELELKRDERKIPIVELAADDARRAFKAWRDKEDRVRY